MKEISDVVRHTPNFNAGVRPKVLLVEPDSLLRWSVEAYLQHRFAVESVSNRPAAEARLRVDEFNAVIVADDLSEHGADSIAALARLGNPDVRVIRTVTNALATPITRDGVSRLEKPFQLSKLEELLSTDL
ncbi:MAG: hypothetical protein AABZ47_00605 [Planctomycetota bacterium]